MYYQMPVLVYEEAGCVRSHSTELAALGKRALIVTGRSSAKENGSLADVRAALDAQQVGSVLFDEVEENPSVETVMRARELGVQERIDFVIGIGGGSPLDAAKAIALMVANSQEPASFLYERREAAPALPVAAIPTTCGTGSEVTAVAVLTDHEKKTKVSMVHKVFPRLALVDAKYVSFAPRSVLSSTGIDALAHLLESGINSNSTDYSRMFVKEGLSVWSRSKEVLTGHREPAREDFRNLMNASTFAGMAIAHTGTSLPHGLSYGITYHLGVPHGKACGYFLAGYLREAPEGMRRELLELGGFTDVEEFAEYLERVCLFERLPADALEQTVDAVASNEAKLRNCPYPVNIDALRRMAGL